MKRVIALLAAVALVGCGASAEQNFRDGFPSSDMVQMNVPSSSGQPLTAQSSAALVGDPSGFYAITRGATVIVNTGVVAVLVLVKAITDNPPTRLTADVAVWGPHTEPLSPTTWKFTVSRTAENSYQYVLEGKAKTADDSTYAVVLSGTHSVATNASGARTPKFGSGTFLLDWDKAKTLPGNDGNVGTAAITYSRLSATAAITVDVAFTQVHDAGSLRLVDADYAFVANPGNGGEFSFSTQKNLDVDLSRALLENLSIKSRWTETGAGRADVKASGGDLQAEATVNECWDASFSSQMLRVSFWSPSNYGEETSCAFTAASYATP